MSTSTETPTTTTAPTTSTAPTTTKTPLPTLLPLEEDDEFEEFPVEDWDQSNTFGATLGGGKEGLDSLWDDNWDNDDIGDDFSVQLRGELEKHDQMVVS